MEAPHPPRAAEFPGPASDARADRRQITVVVVALVVVFATLSLALVYLTRSTGPRYFTMTQYYDLGEGGPNGPWNWPTLANGTVVRVRDRIADVYTDFSRYLTLTFPYTGHKFSADFATAITDDNLCHYGVNDTVRLTGTVIQALHLRAVWEWNLEEESPPPPTATLAPIERAGSEIRIPVAGATGDCRGVHLRVQLWQNGFAVDGMFLRYDGIRGVYLRYSDADGSGTLSAGDVLRVVGPPAGSLEVHLFFRGADLASVAWTSP